MQAAKHALRQHIAARGSISLAQLSIGIAMARASAWDKTKLTEPKYIRPVLATMVIAVVFGLVNSAYVQAFFLQRPMMLIEPLTAGPRSSPLFKSTCSSP